MEKNIYKIGKELFITSEEEIKEGDWCIMTNDYGDNYLVRVISLKCIGGKEIRVQLLLNGKENTPLLEKCEKIILTTDQDLDGVQAIDDEFLEWFVKNPSCERVETYSLKEGNEKLGYHHYKYEIIIPKEEPKQCDICKMYPRLEGTNKCESCYSEEEVLKIIQDCKSYLSFGDEFDEIEWFTQFKKK